MNNAFELHQLFSKFSADIFSPVAGFVREPAFLLGLGRSLFKKANGRTSNCPFAMVDHRRFKCLK